MNGKRMLPGVLAAVVVAMAAGACGESPAGLGDGVQALSAAEARVLAADFEAIGASVVDGELAEPLFSAAPAPGGPAAATSVDVTFTRTRACPLGGSVTVAGRTTGTVDRAARSASRVTDATRTEQGCVFAVRDGATLTLNGSPNVALHAEHSVTGGVPGKRTLTQKGAFAWTRSTGQSGTCTVDLASEYDPATRTATVNGTFCNQTIRITRTRT